ncbi:hypothetical protein HDU92_004969 [Lobulomyces angularis]|nr:hypothetical protein HDU92_004969 [Lobulomyces angularis]
MAAVGDIGLIGLAVMGQNLILNMNDHGYTVVAFNRTVSKVHHFLENEAKGTNIIGAESIQDLCAKLKRPRKIMLLVKAGQAVDDFIKQIIPFLEKGDIIIDGGNSHFPDSVRRTKELEAQGFLFVGAGVSGGEEGARYGPSLMPGRLKEEISGSPAAWPHLQKLFQDISAKTSSGEPCCDWVGEGGSGHYVKMVHNGIEYGDMQIISEAYLILKDVVGLTADEMGDILDEWNKGELNSFLIEITRDILKFKDTDGVPLVEKIRDCAGQKGTGKWTAVSALDNGMPVTLIGEAVFARCLSAIKEERITASTILNGPKGLRFSGDKKSFIEDIRMAVFAAKIISYAQGFMLLREAAKSEGWHLNYGGIALMWRGGCIIRSVFLGDITKAFQTNPNLTNLLLDPFFSRAVLRCTPSFRRVVSQSLLLGVPIPCLASALTFFDGYRTAKGGANILQAQRDYFGAHTYEVPLIDTHNDFPMKVFYKFGGKVIDQDLNNLPTWNTDINRLKKGKVGGQMWSAYVGCNKDFQKNSENVKDTLVQIDIIKRIVESNPEFFEFARSSDDIINIHQRGKLASLIGVEGGHSIDNSLEVLRLHYELGVRYMTLTHGCNTAWADSATDVELHGGLTSFGEIVVQEMNRLGMMVDLSHVSHKTMRHALKISKAPAFFSHSSAFSLCNSQRNVPDDVLKLISDTDGVVMVNFFSGYITCSNNSTLKDVADHVEYIANVAGVDKVGFGADFDGVDELPVGLEDVSKYPALLVELLDRGFTEKEVMGFIGNNFLRVLKKTELVSKHLSDSVDFEDRLVLSKHC